jgi:hypothetical protein
MHLFVASRWNEKELVTFIWHQKNARQGRAKYYWRRIDGVNKQTILPTLLATIAVCVQNPAVAM